MPVQDGFPYRRLTGLLSAFREAHSARGWQSAWVRDEDDSAEVLRVMASGPPSECKNVSSSPLDHRGPHHRSRTDTGTQAL